MGKKILSLCMALVLCLGLLPVTALAVEGAPHSLYVGNTSLSLAEDSYWTTDPDTGLLTQCTGSGDDWNVKYESSSNTLTLREASIQGGSNAVSAPYDSGIYALSYSGQPVSLTIKLIGENTITGFYGIFLDAEASETSYGTGASLTITSENNGSLQVSGLYNGIYVKSGTGNVSLTINDASVVAKTTQTYSSYAGVYVQSSMYATNSPQLSLKVGGGSLTASGTGSSDGILFYVGSSQATGATTSLTVSDNAIVDAKNGGISAGGVSVKPNVNIGSTDSTGGIVFDGKNGTVYGDVTLEDNLTIGEDESLTLDDGASLNAGGHNVIVDGGTLGAGLEEALGDNVKYPPTITTTTLTDGRVGEPYSASLGADGTAPITWSVSGSLPAGLSLNGNTISGTPTTAGTSTFTVKAANDYGSDSKSLSITIGAAALSITTQPGSQSVTEGQTASFSVAATGNGTLTYQWQESTDNGATWANISGATSSSYTTQAATMDMDGWQYRCVVTDGNSNGVTSQAATLTVTAATVSVTGVSLDKTELSLTVGGTETLTATVAPDNATDKTVTWTSSNPSVATVENGVVTAVSAGTATITVTTDDGGKNATCTVTVTVPVTGVTLSQTQASLYYNRTPNTLILTATVVPGNATNKDVIWTSSDSAVATVDQNGVVTAVDRGTATITVTTADGNYTATCTVTVSRYSSGGGSSSSSTSLSDRAIDDIQDARPGDTVEITLRPGRTTLEREVFEELAGQDITLEIDAGDGVLWTVNGLDIPEDTRLHDLDLDVDLGDSDIPATVLNAVTGEVGTVQLSLAHDGQFGFIMTLSAPLGRDNADYWANLYWYNERTEELEFQQAARIAKDGTAEFDLDHASDYAIVIDDRSHEPVDLPFNDVPESHWAYDAIQYVYGEGLMAGTSGSTFNPEGTTTRGQIVTILWRLSGSPVVNYLMDFDDVDPAAYYAEAIRWATSEGIAGGYGGGVFGPDDPITREQLAVMLHRYAQHEGYDVSIGEDTNILSYADAFTVSEYAVSALQWACGAGIISGTGDGSTLTPQGEATRAQAATVLMRFCEQSLNH